MLPPFEPGLPAASAFNAVDVRFMRQAFAEAEAAFEAGEIPVGAVIVAQGRILARGHNQTELLRDVSAHAELLAATAATQALGGKYLTGCTLYVTPEPCPMCAGLLYWARPERIVYGASDEKRGAHRHNPSLYHPRTTIQGGLMAYEAAALLSEFFRLRRES